MTYASGSPTNSARHVEVAARRIRLRVLDAAKRAGVGHIGSALSVVDILATLYAGGLMRLSDADPGRDRLVLSKGHAALALYASLADAGILSDADLESYCAEGSVLATHPESVVPGIDFSSGSLGQGLSVGTGAALAARVRGTEQRTFVLMSDAECDSGATWEAALFAGHHDLRNLTAIVDVNGQQALGYTRDVLDTEPLEEKWASFRWHVVDVDGHSASALLEALAPSDTSGPTVVLARTRLGKGVSFMEGLIKWHYWPMSDAEYAQAIDEVMADAS